MQESSIRGGALEGIFLLKKNSVARVQRRVGLLVLFTEYPCLGRHVLQSKIKSFQVFRFTIQQEYVYGQIKSVRSKSSQVAREASQPWNSGMVEC